jgi:isocitrate dehydrogenase kinase/phosphatase
MEHHKDLFDAKFWKEMQAVHREGQMVDFFPYRRDKVQIGMSL